MCGIFGFAKQEKMLSSLQLHRLRGVVMDLACLNESRGKDGTGMALLSRSEGILFKEALSVSELFKTKRFQKTIRSISDKTLLCLGHTRFATVGSVHTNHCHPFVSEDFIGVHNGHFVNREMLLKKYERTQQTFVDSEAIFRVLDGEKQIRGISSRLEEMTGDFALGFVHKANPYELYLVRNSEKPLHVVYVAKLKTLFWSSERQHLEFALVRNSLKGKVWQIQENHLYTADARNFNGKCNMQKVTCRINMPEKRIYAGEEDFAVPTQPYLFSYDELESAGYLEGTSMNERSKIACSLCRKDSSAGELFYDEISGHFFCEYCSFEYLNTYETRKRGDHRQENREEPLGKEGTARYENISDF